MKPEKCPCALVCDEIKFCRWNVRPCKRVAEKDCPTSDAYKNPFEQIFKEYKEKNE